MPSYWNLIRELQTIDACILTHFDYDVLPGFQTIFHRKTIRSSTDGKLCKPHIGTIFLNKIQLKKIPIQSSPSNNSLVNNLNENIDEFLHDVKQLNIETHDLVKQSTTTNKTKIEPINLFKKIAFGSLDLFVLHPTSSANENDKIVMDLQKVKFHWNDRSRTNFFSSLEFYWKTFVIVDSSSSLVFLMFSLSLEFEEKSICSYSSHWLLSSKFSFRIAWSSSWFVRFTRSTIEINGSSHSFFVTFSRNEINSNEFNWKNVKAK